MVQPRLWLLAGPNGAGKTTYARRTFAEDIAEIRFLNADDIARDLSPRDVAAAALEAGRKLLQRRTSLLLQRQSFVIETTLSGLTLLRFAQEVQRAGYLFRLTFLYVSDPEICIERIAHRVLRGGHFIPSDIVQRRYWRGLQLLPNYIRSADEAEIFAGDSTPTLIARKRERQMSIADPTVWRHVQAAGAAES
jgi:predicted ABC-type ATPase